MSCNGCRVLRKGCSDSCSLRKCLRAIEGADAQGYATAFVAKFFGRASMMGFINAVPHNQKAAVFQSLLHEACGRTINPVHGSVGLLCSGNWRACEEAVLTVLRGGTLVCPPPEADVSTLLPPFPTIPFGSISHNSSALYHAKSGQAAASQSPRGSTFCSLPLKRKSNCDIRYPNLKVKLPDTAQSLSEDSRVDEGYHDARIHKQKQTKDSYKYSNPTICKQEQLSGQQHFEKDVKNECLLELSLGTRPCLPFQPAIKASPASGPSNPSCISFESEGSVTSFNSTKIWNSHKQVLDLLH